MCGGGGTFLFENTFFLPHQLEFDVGRRVCVLAPCFVELVCVSTSSTLSAVKNNLPIGMQLWLWVVFTIRVHVCDSGIKTSLSHGVP